MCQHYIPIWAYVKLFFLARRRTPNGPIPRPYGSVSGRGYHGMKGKQTFGGEIWRLNSEGSQGRRMTPRGANAPNRGARTRAEFPDSTSARLTSLLPTLCRPVKPPPTFP